MGGYDGKVPKYMLDEFDWYFIPVMNPDGYVYSFQEVNLTK